MANEKKSYFLSKLGKRLFAFIGVVILISLIIMMAQGIHCSHRAVKSAADAYLSSMVECKQEHLELWVKERVEDIKILSNTNCLINCNNSKKTSFCNAIYSFKKRSQAYKDIAIFDLTGHQVFSTTKHKHDFAKTRLFRQIMGQEKTSSYQEVYFMCDNLPEMEISCFISNNKGKPSYILLARLNIKGILEEIVHHKIGLGESGKIVVTDQQGKQLACDKNLSPAKMIKQSIEVKPFGMNITAQVPWNEAMQELFLYVKFAISTALLTLVFMFFFVWKVSKSISEPILKIARAARSIAQGDLQQRVDYKGKDEIETLITDFNFMASQLSSNQSIVEKKHKQLQDAYTKINETKLQMAAIEALAATGKMAASIVHEIRNPLSTIKMNLQILTQKQQEPRYQEHGGIALKQIHHLEGMLNGLLDFSRPIELDKKIEELTNVLEAAIEMIAGESTKYNMQINCEVNALKLSCDLQRLQQALSNLLLNSIQASEVNQSIDIKTYLVAKQDKIAIEIKDYGAGISCENIENIFEPFFSLRKGGTGLGLSYVKKIIQLHEGNVEIKSELGQGSCFIITLPV